MSVLVFIEAKSKVSKSALEVISYGSKIGSTTVITYGEISDQELKVIGEYGGEKTLINRNLNDSNDQKITNLICAAVDHTGADVVIISQDQTGKSIGPRVAAKLNAGHVSGAISLPETADGFVVNTNVFSGKAMAKIAVHSAKKVISLLPNSHVPEKTNGSTVIEEFNAELGEGKIVIKELKTQGEGIPLPEAELVVTPAGYSLAA
jgi:electron transfer flavoprotein alpha subunit